MQRWVSRSRNIDAKLLFQINCDHINQVHTTVMLKKAPMKAITNPVHQTSQNHFIRWWVIFSQSTNLVQSFYIEKQTLKAHGSYTLLLLNYQRYTSCRNTRTATCPSTLRTWQTYRNSRALDAHVWLLPYFTITHQRKGPTLPQRWWRLQVLFE